MNDLILQRASYPRVSDILSKQISNEMRSVPIEKLAEACLRGTSVHEYCTSYMHRSWILHIEDRYLPYFEAWKIWADTNIESLVSSNHRLYDDELKITGEYDMIVKLNNGKTALIDLKTSCVPSKTWPLQLAAYRHLCEVNKIYVDEVFIVHLKKQYAKKNGEETGISTPSIKVKIATYDKENISYWDIFTSALKCYDYFDRKECV